MNQQSPWFQVGMVALVVLPASVAIAILVNGCVATVMPTIAAIASVVGIGALLRWAVLPERPKSRDG